MNQRRHIHLDELLGVKVHDIDGKCAGRIEEVRAERRGDECVVVEYHLGTGALMERLSIAGVSGMFVQLLGAHRNPASHCVQWDQMDLTDPKKPRLNVRADELEEIE